MDATNAGCREEDACYRLDALIALVERGTATRPDDLRPDEVQPDDPTPADHRAADSRAANSGGV